MCVCVCVCVYIKGRDIEGENCSLQETMVRNRTQINPWWLSGRKICLPMQEKQIRSLVWEDPLKKGRGTHSVILSGKSHGQRNLVGYSSWGHKDSENDLVIKLPPRKRKELIFFLKAGILKGKVVVFRKQWWEIKHKLIIIGFWCCLLRFNTVIRINFEIYKANILSNENNNLKVKFHMLLAKTKWIEAGWV